MMYANGLAKLVEELGELQLVLAKKLAFQDTDTHPDGKGSLKERMEDEMADVEAASIFVSAVFGLDMERMDKRVKMKLERFLKWHNDSSL